MNIPADFKYTSTHEWVNLVGDTATVGITDHAQSELGDIVFVELPEAGRVVKAGDSIGSVESVKTVSDIYAPISGEIVESNSLLGAQSDLVNSDPYGKGYLVKIKIADVAEVNALHDAEAYKGLVH